MSAPNNPQPGEIWLTSPAPGNKGVVAEYRETGWHWVGQKERFMTQDRLPMILVGYTPDYVHKMVAEVEQLTADLDGAAYRAGESQSRLAHAQAERDAAAAAVERLTGAVEDVTDLYHVALDERDAAVAAVERVKALAARLESDTSAVSVVAHAFADEILFALAGD